MGGYFLPEVWVTDITVPTDKTVTELLSGKHTPEGKNFGTTLEAYKATYIFIPVDITEDVVKSVARNFSVSTGPSVTYLEALHGWLLKFGYHIKKLCISVEYFMDWLDIQNPP